MASQVMLHRSLWRRSEATSLKCLLVLSAALLPVGCGDDVDTQDRTTVHRSGSNPLDRKWLEINSTVRPAQWVLDWRQPKERPASDPDVEKVQKHLTAAHNIYRESERMIANRAVQLEQMLEKLNVDESAANIVEDVSSIAGEVGQTEGFGAVIQHYYILRSNEHDRASALALLKSRYGTRVPNPANSD